MADRDSVRSAWNRLFLEDPLRGLWIQIHSGRRLPFPAFVPGAAQAVLTAFTRSRPGQTNNVCGTLISRGANGIISRLAGISCFRLNTPPGLFLTLAGAMDRRARREPYYPLNLTPCAFHDCAVSSAKAGAELDFVPTLVKQGACQTIKSYRDVGFLKNRR